MEVWKEIKGFETLYEVSNTGKVRRIKSGRILKEGNSRGYKRVGLSKENKVYWKQVHRLVAETFIPNPEEKPQVDHINCIRDDNRVENLRWVTVSENNRNPITLGKHIGRLINRKDQSRRVAQYTTDGKLIRIFDSISETGRSGFDYTCVGKCVMGERKTHKGFKWIYA